MNSLKPATILQSQFAFPDFLFHLIQPLVAYWGAIIRSLRLGQVRLTLGLQALGLVPSASLAELDGGRWNTSGRSTPAVFQIFGVHENECFTFRVVGRYGTCKCILCGTECLCTETDDELCKYRVSYFPISRSRIFERKGHTDAKFNRKIRLDERNSI